MRDYMKRLRLKISMLNEQEKATVKEMNLLLEGKDIIIKTGKYKERSAKIIKYYSDVYGEEMLDIKIYRLDGRIGFKGQEKFISDHPNEFIRFKDCEFA